jgi:4-hydroxy-3-polyprenylbenzoate decarboxylase
MKQKLIIGISGASGIIYGYKLLTILKSIETIETHLVISKAAELTFSYEAKENYLNINLEELKKLADIYYPIKHIGAAIASGSYKTMGMIIAPCSIKSMSEIATGVTSNLLTRAADVCLKERRKLVLMVRETPLHLGHLRTMTALTEMGAIIYPPVPAFYNENLTIETMVEQTLHRILDLFDIEVDNIQRWQG